MSIRNMFRRTNQSTSRRVSEKSAQSARRRQKRTLRMERLEERMVLSGGSIAGVVFHDLDGSGSQDGSETGIAGATVFLDTNQNGALDGGEVSTTTLADGSYQFAGLAAGDYTVAQVLPDGWLQTAANSPGVGRAGEVTRLLAPVGTIASSGIAWVNGDLFQAERSNANDTFQKIWRIDPDSGAATYLFDLPANAHHLTYDGTNLWAVDHTADKIYHVATDGTLLHTFDAPSTNTSGIAWDGEYLWANDTEAATIRKLDISDLSGTQLPVVGSIPAVPASTGQSRGLAFDGQHLWMSSTASDLIYQIDRATGTVLQTVDPPMVSATNSNPGPLAFDGHLLWFLEFGAAKWLKQMDPGGDHRAVTVVDDETSIASAIGNTQVASISGTAFSDANADGDQDAGEAGLAGWQVFLDIDGNGQLDTAEISTVTDAAGNYELNGRVGRTYDVTIVVKPEWTLISPTEPYTVTVTTSGQVEAGLDFAVLAPPPTKFYVVNDGAPDRTYEYGPDGAAMQNYTLGSANSAPRGVASNAVGDRVWVLDANKGVFVYDTAGTLLGSWGADVQANWQPQGITTYGNDIWMVDAKYDGVRFYGGQASRLSGSSMVAPGGFNLANGNKNPSDIVTDGTHIWVTEDGGQNKVFKYTMAGTLVGSWTIASPNSTPTGITLDPTGASNDLWIVDSGTDKVYRYAGGKAWTSGTRSASSTFNLSAGNTNPQGIADPPTGGGETLQDTPADDQPGGRRRERREARRREAVFATPFGNDAVGSASLALAQQASETSKSISKKAREAAFAQEDLWLGGF